MPEPELLISLHGSALLPELISGHIVAGHLKDEIYRTALSTKAWITTNGLNCGVAALMGSARRELGREFGDTIPIIGFPRWDEVKDNDLLVKDGPSQVNFSSKSGVQYYTKDLGWFEFVSQLHSF